MAVLKVARGSAQRRIKTRGSKCTSPVFVAPAATRTHPGYTTLAKPYSYRFLLRPYNLNVGDIRLCPAGRELEIYAVRPLGKWFARFEVGGIIPHDSLEKAGKEVR